MQHNTMHMKIHTHHLTILALKLSTLLPVLLEATATAHSEQWTLPSVQIL